MSNPPQTSVSLILRVANEGDVAAWNQFSEIYQPLVYRIAISRGLQSADAHDLVQEVMTRVARSVSNWDPDRNKGTFRGWISRIARNLVIDFIKKKNRLPRTSDQSDIRRLIETKPDESTEDEVFKLAYEKQVFITAAKRIQNKFADNTWDAFWRTSVLNEPIQQVANSLNMTQGAIYVARSRVMSQLKQTVKSLGELED